MPTVRLEDWLDTVLYYSVDKKNVLDTSSKSTTIHTENGGNCDKAVSCVCYGICDIMVLRGGQSI